MSLTTSIQGRDQDDRCRGLTWQEWSTYFSVPGLWNQSFCLRQQHLGLVESLDLIVGWLVQCLLAPTLRLDLRLSLGSSALIGHPISSAQRQSQSQTRQTPDAAPASGWIIFYFSNTAPGLFVPVLHHFTLRLPYLTCQTIATQLQASPPFCLTQLGQIRFLLSSSVRLLFASGLVFFCPRILFTAFSLRLCACAVRLC